MNRGNSRRLQALFQVLKKLWKEEKEEHLNQLSLYSTENINEGFQIINENWSTQSKQYVCTMDIPKCFDSIQIVFDLLIMSEIAPFIGHCSFETH